MARGDLRLFVAMPVPDDAAHQCEARLAGLSRSHPGARWVPAPFLHLTLVFLGAVTPGRVAGLEADIAAAAAETAAFDVSLVAGNGRVGRRGDGVAWLSAGEGGSHATQLANALHARIRGDDPGAPAGDRPHVTVARHASPDLIRDLRGFAPDPPITWRADRIVLFRSHLGPPGARYERVLDRALR
ncbi:MAG: RNA 2',3'-cyclic phosphodiesterase [Candidatus Limnocylindrales bacterium]